MSENEQADVPTTSRLNFGQKTEVKEQEVPVTAASEAEAQQLVEDQPMDEGQEEVGVVAASPNEGVQEPFADAETAQDEAFKAEADVQPEPTSEAPVEAPTETPVEAGLAEVENTQQDAEAEAPSEAAEVPALAEDEAEARAETEAEVSTGEAPTDEPEAAEVNIETPVPNDDKSVEDLTSERDRLDAEIKARKNAEKASVIDQIKTVVQTYDITTEELVEALGGLKSKRKGVKAKPKYKDPATGVVWSGRGKAPAWIKGKDFSKFLIPEDQQVRPD